ncbi:MAG: carbohydrate ABC transporter permease [Mobilitalea sp.]
MVVKNKMKQKEKIWGQIFVMAPMIQFTLFFLLPVLFCIYAGFTNWNILESSKDFIAFDNFKEIFTDPKFWKALSNTFFMLLTIPCYLFLSLLFAMAINRKILGNKVFRVIYYLPYITSIVALVIVWKWLFNADYGLVNNMLKTLFNINGPNWLSDPKWVKINIVMMIVWKMIGISAIYYLAALQNIPKSYYEAAKIDGASGTKMFFGITFPLITPITFYLTIVGIIGSLQTFVEVQLFTTDGGRNYNAATLVYYVWQKAFKYNEMGYACATVTLFGIMIMAITLIQFKISNKWVYEGEQ